MKTVVKLVGSPHTISYADELSCRGYSVVGLNKHLWYKFRYTVMLIPKLTIYCFDVHHNEKQMIYTYHIKMYYFLMLRHVTKLTFISDAFLYPVSYRVLKNASHRLCTIYSEILWHVHTARLKIDELQGIYQMIIHFITYTWWLECSVGGIKISFPIKITLDNANKFFLFHQMYVNIYDFISL